MLGVAPRPQKFYGKSREDVYLSEKYSPVNNYVRRLHYSCFGAHDEHIYAVNREGLLYWLKSSPGILSAPELIEGAKVL
jgi:hypothetical protein